MRYKIVGGSCSGHCCFDYTIIDMLKENEGKYYRNVAESFYEDEAITICKALNLMHSNQDTFEFIDSNSLLL